MMNLLSTHFLHSMSKDSYIYTTKCQTEAANSGLTIVWMKMSERIQSFFDFVKFELSVIQMILCELSNLDYKDML